MTFCDHTQTSEEKKLQSDYIPNPQPEVGVDLAADTSVEPEEEDEDAVCPLLELTPELCEFLQMFGAIDSLVSEFKRMEKLWSLV